MFDVTKKQAVSKGALCRVGTKVGLALTCLALAGCMNSVTTTMNATSDVTSYAIATFDNLDLSDELMADAMTIQRIVVTSSPRQATASLANADSADIADPFLLDKQPEDLEQEQGLAWSNDLTGSQGEISYISEKPSGKTICRKFKTSRLSFEGVSLYKGVSCQSSSGGWKLQHFYQVS